MQIATIIVFLITIIVIVIAVNRMNIDKFDPNQRLSRFVLDNKKCNESLYEYSIVDYADTCQMQYKTKINLLDDQYVDVDQFAGYNSLLDDETKKFYRNHANFPLVNGPPKTDILYYINS